MRDWDASQIAAAAGAELAVAPGAGAARDAGGPDRVVIDSAPVGIITDTRIAARLADRVLYVARWGRTPGSVARDGLARLREAGIEPAGVVLTQAETRGPKPKAG